MIRLKDAGPIVVHLVEQGTVGGDPCVLAVCATGRCTWQSRPQVVKAAAREEARWHRERHRQARLEKLR